MISAENFVQLSEQQVAIALPFNQRLYLKGKIKLSSVLMNEVEVQGYKFTSNCHFPQEIYSPRGYSLLYFESIMSANNDFKTENCDKKIRKIVKNFGSTCSIFILEKLDTTWTHYLEKGLIFSDSKKQKMAIFGREKWKKDNIIAQETIEEVLDVSLILQEEFEEMKFRLINVRGNWEYISPYDQWELAVEHSKFTTIHQGKY